MINNKDTDSLLFMIINARNRLQFIDKSALGTASVNIFAEGNINLSIEELGKRIRNSINQLDDEYFLMWYKLFEHGKINDCVLNGDIIPIDQMLNNKKA